MPGKKISGASQKPKAKKASPKPIRMAMAEGHSAIETWLGSVKPELQPVARRIDQLIMEAMPNAVCSLKWGVPFYGLPDRGWVTAINSFKAHVKLLFFAGKALNPVPPEGKENNAIDFHSGEELNQNEKQIRAWLQQAKKLQGWNLKNFPNKTK